MKYSFTCQSSSPTQRQATLVSSPPRGSPNTNATPVLMVAVSAVPVKSGVSSPTGLRNASTHSAAASVDIRRVLPWAWSLERRSTRRARALALVMGWFTHQ